MLDSLFNRSFVLGLLLFSLPMTTANPHLLPPSAQKTDCVFCPTPPKDL